VDRQLNELEKDKAIVEKIQNQYYEEMVKDKKGKNKARLYESFAYPERNKNLF